MTQAVLGIIGGSGIYDLPGLENVREETIASSDMASRPLTIISAKMIASSSNMELIGPKLTRPKS